MENKTFAKEKEINEEYQNPFNDDFLASLNKDYGNFNLQSNENEDDFLTNLNTEINLQNYFPEKSNKNNDNTFMFSNSFIQTSILKQNNLKKIIVIKYLSSIKIFFKKWKTLKRKADNFPPSFQNQFIMEKLLNSNSSVNNFIQDCSKNFRFVEEKSNGLITNKTNFEFKDRILKKLFSSKIKEIYNCFLTNLKIFILKHKVHKAYISLFISVCNSKMKTKRISNEIKSFSQRNYEFEKKINKLEQNLNEKAGIITKKNDTIETLTEQIENLNKKVKNLESKKGQFNVIHESLCSKCSNTLEESFVSTSEKHKNINFEVENSILNEKILSFQYKENDLKKTIQEQLDYILKLEQENKDLRLKNIEYKAKNDSVIKELENIKEDFKTISQSFNKKSNYSNTKDTFMQTDEIKTAISKNKSKSKPKIKAKTEKTVKKSVVSNLNLKQLEESTNSSKPNKLINVDSSRSDREMIQNLKFDNSLLTQEIVNLNKELMKLRNESKSYNENLKKLEKEKNDFKLKFSSKFDNFEKIKKENEELMIMIQTSNYKTVYSIDNENKRLKDEINLIKNELEILKQETLTKEKKFRESENEIEVNKKNIELINKFKGERENLILENTKLDSEMKKIRFEIEDIKKLCDKQEILIKNKDESISKLTQDINYIAITAKKSKQEAERAIQDALGFQQIVRKIEKELNDVIGKKEKAENELNLIKQQSFIKNKY